MSIINSTAHPFHANGCSCFSCGEPVYPPYMVWLGFAKADNFYLCPECAHALKDAFSADLIQLAAIQEISLVSHQTYVLERITRREADERHKPIELESDCE